MGLMVDEIVDVVHDRLNIELGAACPGLLGSAVVAGQARLRFRSARRAEDIEVVESVGLGEVVDVLVRHRKDATAAVWRAPCRPAQAWLTTATSTTAA